MNRRLLMAGALLLGGVATVAMAMDAGHDDAAACSACVTGLTDGTLAVGTTASAGWLGTLFDTSAFPPRWQCGQWGALHGWTHIISDGLIFLAYAAIPAALWYFIRRRPDMPFPKIFWLFGAFIAACGLVHLMEAAIFWWPAYRVSAALKVATAVVSWATVAALVPLIPRALALPQLEVVNRQLRNAEAQARQVIEAAPAGMLMVDADGAIVMVNSQVERTFGYTRDELIGQPVEMLLPQRFREAHRGDRKRYMAKPVTRRMGGDRELYGIRKDGSDVPVEIGLNPMQTEHGMCVLAAIVDISERKRTEDDLARERKLLRAVLDNAPDYIFVKDRQGRYVLNNGMHRDLLGVKREQDITGKSDSDFHPQHEAAVYCASDQHVLDTGKPLTNLEESVVDAQGRQRWVATNRSALRDAEGDIVGLVGVSRDITELHEARAELEQTNEQLKRNNEEMEQFVYTVSHDLKSPLVSCMGFVNCLRDDLKSGDRAAVDDALVRIERNVLRMETCINDLLELSRVGRIRHDPQWQDMNEVIESIVEELQPRIDDAGATVSVQADLPRLFADPVRVVEVFENLLTNALKYGCMGDDRRIEIGGTCTDRDVRYYVRDHGQGIASQYHEKIFGLFQRLVRGHDGSGVGLAIVNRILEMHGGKAWVESEQDRGATFWVAFPRTDEEAQAA